MTVVGIRMKLEFRLYEAHAKPTTSVTCRGKRSVCQSVSRKCHESALFASGRQVPLGTGCPLQHRPLQSRDLQDLLRKLGRAPFE